MAREFVLISDNHAPQFIMQQPKLNQKHVKWVEYLQGFTFVLKHISGQSDFQNAFEACKNPVDRD